MNSPERQQLVNVMCELLAQGLGKGCAGNASLRAGDKEILITPSGLKPADTSADDIVRINLQGEVIEGQCEPSSEWPMHAAVYRNRRDIHAIVHCHSTYATIIACTRQAIPPFHYMVAVAGGTGIPCTDYARFGSAELAETASHALEDHNACLLSNHGQLACGTTLEKAFDLAVEVEELAKQYWGTLAIGGATILDEEEMRAVVERFKSYGN
jgi:L-fuculose-phosphate aldolase